MQAVSNSRSIRYKLFTTGTIARSAGFLGFMELEENQLRELFLDNRASERERKIPWGSE
jgi:hypothetical protein